MNRSVKSKKRNQNTRNVRNSRGLKGSNKNILGRFFSVITGPFSEFFQQWFLLPLFHQRAILVVFALWLFVIFMPFSENPITEQKKQNEPIIVPIRLSERGNAREEYYEEPYSYQAPESYERPIPDLIEHEQLDTRYDDDFEDEVVRIEPDLETEISQSRFEDTYLEQENKDDTQTDDDKLSAFTRKQEMSHYESEPDTLEHKVQRGDNFTRIFEIHGLNLRDLYAILAIEGHGKPISRIKVGQSLRFRVSLDNALETLEVDAESNNPVVFLRQHNGKFARID